jgi:hypothetical protein
MHGIMCLLLGCETYTICKYTKIICGILINRNEFLNTYIHASNDNKLQKIIKVFANVIGLLIICEAIDST